MKIALATLYALATAPQIAEATQYLREQDCTPKQYLLDQLAALDVEGRRDLLTELIDSTTGTPGEAKWLRSVLLRYPDDVRAIQAGTRVEVYGKGLANSLNVT